jgi:hypothetical protein
MYRGSVYNQPYYVNSWSPPVTVVQRPEIKCSFRVMDTCTSVYKDDDQRKACVEGVRDAHLFRNQNKRFETHEEQKAYDSGRFTTVEDCTPPTVMTNVVV